LGVIENAKEIAELVKKLGNVELYKKIVELEGEVIELTREKRALEENNHELAEKLALAGKMTFEKPFYFQEGDRVPFCPRCWEKERVAIHLQNVGHVTRGYRYDCPDCKGMFFSPQLC
jgi:hypothetical protein